ncbi:MAG: carboxymuconolactone decarboxylase family protein [Gemmatimonadaceae bacterium]|nr:carboxymuconolactone decarboxylase family protein [Gemmatimonadaceae bacterium]
MGQRINYSEVAPEGIRALGGLEAYVRSCGLEPGLLALLRTRASPRNRCASWRESPYYTARERAALAWAEAAMFAGHGSAPDALYQESRQHFSEKELVDLTLALVAIIGWNRLDTWFHPGEPGACDTRSRSKS